MLKKCLFSLICLFTALSLEADLLKEQDIHIMMNELFKQHVSKKQMTEELLHQGYINYILQFDPNKEYLLQKEVHPWVNIDPHTLRTYLDEYQKGDYSSFFRLNAQIQVAIGRAQKIRQDLFQNPTPLFNAASQQEIPLPFYNNFAIDEAELKNRIRQQTLGYISSQEKKFGRQAVLSHEVGVLKNFERKQHALEDRYLFVQEGRTLGEKERENLLSINILRALSKSLDPHTAFLEPDEAYEMRIRLDKGFQGVGLEFEDGLEGVVVSKIEPNSSASKSGKIHINDVLIAVDGKSTTDLSFDEVMALLTQNSHPVVKLTFVSEGDNATPTTVNLQKSEMTTNDKRVDVSYIPFGNGIIGKITLFSFYEGDEGISSEKDIRQAIEHLEKVGNLRGLVLDLRENGGGYLTQAVKVAGLFITNGVVVISKYTSGESHIFRDLEGKATFNGPLVVLVSRKTASAAEIVTQALQDYGVALVVGDDHTFGKGSIQSQTITGNPGSSYFKVTVGKYYTVSGKSPQGTGVQSDIVVPGLYMKEKIGEVPMDYPAQFDHVQPEFNDDLKDIKPEIKPWYLKYYTPTLQHKVDQWTHMLPTLKRNSSYRLEHNKNYQLFLKGEVKKDEDSDQEEEDLFTPKGPKNHGVEDLQMDEAVNIVEDMIRLESNQHGVIDSVGKPMMP